MSYKTPQFKKNRDGLCMKFYDPLVYAFLEKSLDCQFSFEQIICFTKGKQCKAQSMAFGSPVSCILLERKTPSHRNRVMKKGRLHCCLSQGSVHCAESGILRTRESVTLFGVWSSGQ
eukprot:2457069-Amphidinium_carterae.2